MQKQLLNTNKILKDVIIVIYYENGLLKRIDNIINDKATIMNFFEIGKVGQVFNVSKSYIENHLNCIFNETDMTIYENPTYIKWGNRLTINLK